MPHRDARDRDIVHFCTGAAQTVFALIRPRKGSPVVYPKPKITKILVPLSSPIVIPTLAAPILEDFVMIFYTGTIPPRIRGS